MSDLHVLLLANYAPDRQPSMQRFAQMLYQELQSQGVSSELWRPPAIVGRRAGSQSGIGKWLGYTDKFLLFPPRLRARIRRLGQASLVVHVCDHSNAMYVPWIRDLPHVVTCHDLLAVRAALGEFPHARTRWTGRRLQQFVRRGLGQAARIVCDSEATRRDVRRIVPSTNSQTVIYPAVSPAFKRLSAAESIERITPLQPDAPCAANWPRAATQPFILHVGANQWYKNRQGLIDIYAALVERMPSAPPLVLVGKALTNELIDVIATRSLSERVVVFSDITDVDLAALYSSAALLLFPSLAEGFGWPVLEAMACGCRVVASDRAPINEVAGDCASYFDPTSPAAAAGVVQTVLCEPVTVRQARSEAGLVRAGRFTTRAMAGAYLDVYRDAAGSQLDAA